MKKKNKKKTKNSYLLLIIVLFCLVILIIPRVLNYKNTLVSKEVIFVDPDSCYHARRIIYIATHMMFFPFYDPLIAHPYGAIPRWPPLFDWFLALPSFLISLGSPSVNLILKSAILLNLFFGLAEIFILALLIYFVCKNLFISFLSALTIGLTYPQIKFTSLNNLDHNSFLLLLFSVSIYISFRKIWHNQNSINIGIIILLSIVIAAFFWTWAGSYIYILTIALLHFIYPLLNKNYGMFKKYALAYFISGIFLLPLSLITYKFTKKLLKLGYTTFFPIIFLWTISLGFYLIIILIEIRKKKIFLVEKNKVKFITAIFIIIIIILISLIALSKGLFSGFKIALAENIWMSSIAESQPLFYLTSGPIKLFSLSKAISFFGYLIYIFPVGFILIVIRRIDIPFPFYYFIVITAFVFGFLSFFQQKFSAELAIPYGITLALFSDWLIKKIKRKNSLLSSIIFIAIILFSYFPINENLKRQNNEFYDYINAIKWLKKELNLVHTEINTGHIQADGIMAPWDLGHHIKLYGEIPTISDNFGLSIEPNAGFFDMMKFFMTEKEEEAIKLLDKYKVTYVAVPIINIFQYYPSLLGWDYSLYFKYNIKIIENREKIFVEPLPKFFNTIAFRLGYLYGSANPFKNINKINMTALKNFRLIYESPRTNDIKAPFRSNIKIFKYVKGAKIKFPILVNSFYILEAPIISNNGNIYFYRQFGNLNIGESITVPYPNEKFKDYPYALYYRILIGQKLYEISQITEKAIKEGGIYLLNN